MINELSIKPPQPHCHEAPECLLSARAPAEEEAAPSRIDSMGFYGSPFDTLSSSGFTMETNCYTCSPRSHTFGYLKRFTCTLYCCTGGYHGWREWGIHHHLMEGNPWQFANQEPGNFSPVPHSGCSVTL